MNAKTNLGAVTAYAIAVKYGYTGTEEEWAKQFENIGEYTDEAIRAIVAKGNESLAAIQKKAEDSLKLLPGDVTQIATDISQLSDSLEAYKNGVDVIPLMLVKDEYALHDGTFSQFKDWSRTDFIHVKKGERIYINTSVASAYNNVYDIDKNYLNYFATEIGETTKLWEDKDVFIVLSNTTVGMNGTTITRKLKPVIDDNEESEKTTFSSKKIISLLPDPTDIKELKDTVFGSDVEITYVENEYVNNTGAFEKYNAWSRTDYIPCDGVSDFTYTNDGVATSYNAFYDANKNFISLFSIQKTQTGNYPIPSNAEYMVWSNYSSAIRSINWTNKPSGQKGLVDKVDELAQDIKIVMPSTLVALVNEEFDVHYDNIIANYDAELLPYKECFGGATYSMKNFGRNLVTTVGDTSGGVYFSKVVPNALYARNLPKDVVKKSFTFKTIARNSGSGLNRKVLLIGDSWTAPGIYARELRTLFENAEEPMNITLLGTLGDGGAEVGASSGYHEGHGGSSSKEFCTKASHNGYNNHFYNPSSQTFDFAYYMNYCGYTSVDDVFINLGINDVATMEDFDEIISYYDKMINSIKAYSSNIKIFIGLCGLPADYEYSVMNNNGMRSKARRLLFHERLMKEYGNKENEKMFIVPLHLSIDSKHDFKIEQKPRSFRDSTLVDYCTDNVHPSTIAYNKIADRIRTYIKYAETI